MPGAEVIPPMAAPVLGGLLVADEVIDIFLPVLYFAVHNMALEEAASRKPPDRSSVGRSKFSANRIAKRSFLRASRPAGGVLIPERSSAPAEGRALLTLIPAALRSVSEAPPSGSFRKDDPMHTGLVDLAHHPRECPGLRIWVSRPIEDPRRPRPCRSDIRRCSARNQALSL